MYIALAFVGFVTAAFIAGKIYGARAEAEAIALGLKAEADVVVGAKIAVEYIKGKVSSAFARIKKFL